MHIRYTVELETEEREVLRALCQGGCPRVRKVKRAQILLAADSGQSDAQIAAALSVGTATVYRTKRDFVERGLPRALEEAPRPGAARKLSEKEELLLVAVACSDPPTGRARWTLELLAGEMVRLTAHEHLGQETVRRRLHEKQLKPWQHKMWCIPKVDAEYVARMEDVLELYTQPADDKNPVVCFDETPVQLLGETRTPQPPAPGRPAHLDYERTGPSTPSCGPRCCRSARLGSTRCSQPSGIAICKPAPHARSPRAARSSASYGPA